MKIGFIGCGNMASAIIRGILAQGKVMPNDILASDASPAARSLAQESFGICPVSNAEAAGADILFLAVKPQYYEEVIREIKDAVPDHTVLVSIAPGKTLAWLKEQFASDRKIVRTMPNTPAMVGAGMTGVCPNELVTEQELASVLSLLESFGKAQVVPENLLDVVTAVSGSSPALVFVLIEAMADGAVADGMPRAQAYDFAAQAVLGSAKLALESGKHPAQLKDMVCSPGGTTMEMVRVLEAKGFRSAVFEAEKACVKKARSM